jgi:hypothetical protein
MAMKVQDRLLREFQSEQPPPIVCRRLRRAALAPRNLMSPPQCENLGNLTNLELGGGLGRASRIRGFTPAEGAGRTRKRISSMPRSTQLGSQSQRPRVWRVENSKGAGVLRLLSLSGSLGVHRIRHKPMKQTFGVLLGVVGAYYLVFLPLKMTERRPVLSSLELHGVGTQSQNARSRTVRGKEDVDMIVHLGAQEDHNVSQYRGINDRKMNISHFGSMQNEARGTARSKGDAGVGTRPGKDFSGERYLT